LAKQKKRAAKPVYQLKITLKYSEPPVWRRVLIEEDDTLEDLHYLIQRAMGWDNSHLHEFIIKKVSYMAAEQRGDLDVKVESHATLRRVLTRSGMKFSYLYDFGDGWEHDIVVEKRLERDPDLAYPLCIDGARACPPEDCGGAPGYARVLDCVDHPEDPDYKDLREWLGPYDPDAFDVEAVNQHLREDFVEEDEVLPLENLSEAFLEEILGRLIEHMKRERGLKSLDDVAEHADDLQQHELEAMLVRFLEEDMRERAHLLALSAYSTESEDDALRWTDAALQIDPDCIDALLIQAEILSETDEEYTEELRAAAYKAERLLGRKVMKQYEGRLAECALAMPLMRAHTALADALRVQGKVKEAAKQYELLMELDKEDYTVVRSDLVGCLLLAEDLKGARQVFEAFRDRPTPALRWGEVLERFLSGDEDGARQALARAREQSPELEDRLVGKVADFPGREDVDDPENAVRSSMAITPAWRYFPKALAWLEQTDADRA